MSDRMVAYARKLGKQNLLRYALEVQANNFFADYNILVGRLGMYGFKVTCNGIKKPKGFIGD